MRRTLEERWLRDFLHRSVVVRWLIVLVSLGGLILLTLGGGALDPVGLSVGQICPVSVVASVDFQSFDEKATLTEAERRAALAPNVYRLVLEDFRRDLTRLEHVMERLDSIKPGTKGADRKLKEAIAIWNEGSSVSLIPADAQVLFSMTDRSEFLSRLTRFGTQIMVAGVVGDDQFSNPEAAVVMAEKADDLSRINVTKAGQLLTVTQARQKLLNLMLGSGSLPSGGLKTLERLVAELIVPNFQYDRSLSLTFQEQERRMVRPVNRSFTRGMVLVERGERLTDEKVAILKSHETQAEKQFSKESRWRQKVGLVAWVLVIFGIAVLVFAYNPGAVPATNRELTLLSTIVLLHFAICRLCIYGANSLGLSSSLIPFILPVCFGPMLVAILIHRRQAHVVAFVCSFLLGVVTQSSFAVMLTSLASAVVAIHFVSPLRRRGRIYESGLMAGLASGFVSLVFGWMWEVPLLQIGWQSGCAIGAALGASLVISALLPVLEMIFKVTTDLRWLELADLNHPLLRRMVMEAPGTYHHSLVVANLAERACEAIGADGLQARVCSYFHDIGKLTKPEYFCENQIEGENPHDYITPHMSALIIIAHVKDGIDLALQARLPRPILDTIQEHHGTSQVTYFYRVAKRNEEDAKLGSKIMLINTNDVPRVEEETYRYPGPKPVSRENGIISMADAVEGASRSMVKPTPQKIEALVAEIIDERYRDGQLEDCALEFKDLKVIAESFSKTLLSMMHARVSYPKDETHVDQSPSFPSSASQ